MKKYNIQKNNKKMVASILSASVLFSMLAGCSNVEQYIRTNSSNSSSSSYTTETIINTDINSTIDASSIVIDRNDNTSNTELSTTQISEPSTNNEPVDPYENIRWESDSAEAFNSYLMVNYNINLEYYIKNFGLDDYLNVYFTEYINLTRGTNFESVPWYVTKNYFRSFICKHFPNENINEYDGGEINYTVNAVVKDLFEASRNPYFDFEFFSILYLNDITFGNKIPKNIYDLYYNDSNENLNSYNFSSSMFYNLAFNNMYWYFGEFSIDVREMNQENVARMNEFLSSLYIEYGYPNHPNLGDSITEELLLYMYPDRAEEIEELVAQKEAMQASQESQVEPAETTRSH